MEFAEENQVMSFNPETLKVCSSTHNSDVNLSTDNDRLYEYPNDLCHRAPSVQYVVDKLKGKKIAKMLVDHSYIFPTVDRQTLNSELWEDIHLDIIVALSKYTAIVKKDVKKSTLAYIKGYAFNDTCAVGMHTHFSLSSNSACDSTSPSSYRSLS